MSGYCLYCQKEILSPLSWTSIFSKTELEVLCETCKNRLETIKGPVCKTCCRPLEQLEPQYVSSNQCNDCIRWEIDPLWANLLQKNDSIYLYNDFLKELISQWKFRGDYVLVKAFAKPVRKKLKEMEFDKIVPIPLSRERLAERGFNQSEALVREAGFEPFPLLKRVHAEKQSKKSRLERIRHKQVFKMAGSFQFSNEKILLVDDIYTTGATLRHAAKILKQSGAKEIASLTLARG